MSENGNLPACPTTGSNDLPPAPVWLRAKQICGPLLPIGLSTWWLWAKLGKIPKGVKLSSRITVWRREDVLALVDRLSSPEAE